MAPTDLRQRRLLSGDDDLWRAWEQVRALAGINESTPMEIPSVIVAADQIIASDKITTEDRENLTAAVGRLRHALLYSTSGDASTIKMAADVLHQSLVYLWLHDLTTTGGDGD